MKKEMIGLGAACIYAMSAIYFLYLFYAYIFTDALFLFMYPHWVILLSLVLATMDEIISIHYQLDNLGMDCYSPLIEKMPTFAPLNVTFKTIVSQWLL